MTQIIEVNLVDVLSRLEGKIDHIQDDLTTVKIDVEKLKTQNEQIVKRIDTIESTLTNRIDTIESTLTNRIDNVEKRMDNVEANLTKRMDNVEANLSKRMDNVENRLNTMNLGFLGLVGVLVTKENWDLSITHRFVKKEK